MTVTPRILFFAVTCLGNLQQGSLSSAAMRSMRPGRIFGCKEETGTVTVTYLHQTADQGEDGSNLLSIGVPCGSLQNPFCSELIRSRSVRVFLSLFPFRIPESLFTQKSV